MSRMNISAVLLGMLLMFDASISWATNRVALIIGNGDYQQISTLTNPTNDGALLAQSLRELNFNVIEVYDASHDEMRKAISRFGEELEYAGQDGIGFFFYAGHAVQLVGANYLIPVDASVSDESDLSIESIHLELVMHQMAFAQPSASFIVLDACRNNPFSGDVFLPDGLAQVRAPRQSIVSYSTEPGGVALDGTGDNSPYTSALAAEIKKPGITAEQMFKRVRKKLLDKTKSEQISWESSSLSEDVFFVPGSESKRDLSEPTVVRLKTEINWEKFDWEELSWKHRNQWSALGWNEASWDGDSIEPQSEDKIWNALTEKERAAAISLGFTQDIWDGTG